MQTGGLKTVAEYFELAEEHFVTEDHRALDEPAGADSDVLASSSCSDFIFSLLGLKNILDSQ